MRLISKRFLYSLVSAVLIPVAATGQQGHLDASTAAQQTLEFPTVLYGAAYYNEYMPGDQDARLTTDIAMMKAAGLNVVRMGESTWSLWEPEDGRFEYAWMDRVVDAMGKAGIKVILGTPTYSVPAWMAHQHPEILADRPASLLKAPFESLSADTAVGVVSEPHHNANGRNSLFRLCMCSKWPG